MGTRGGDRIIIYDVIFPCAGYLSMAGEAIRQITGAEDFSFRSITVQTAWIPTESTKAEILTSFRPVKLTNTLECIWSSSHSELHEDRGYPYL
jgi:hypothetical protein